MYCYNCKNQFYIKRSFLTLFETKKYYICDTCRKAFPIKLKYEEIPLESYTLLLVSIFDFTYKLSIEAYIREISAIIFFFITRHKNCFLVFLENVSLTDYLLEQLSFLADVEKKHILLICCDVKK